MAQHDPVRLIEFEVQRGSHTYQQLDGWTNERLDNISAAEFLRLLSEIIVERPVVRDQMVEIINDYLGPTEDGKAVY